MRDVREKAWVGWDARVHGRIPAPIAASIDAARYGGDRGLRCFLSPGSRFNLPRNPSQLLMRSSFEQLLEGKSQAPSVTTLRLGAKLIGRTECTGPAYPGLRSHWPELVWITRKWAVCA